MKRDEQTKMDPGQEEDARESAQANDGHDFPIVGIGASAGGLAAFERFFTNLPKDINMAFVVIQHLSPPHKSILPEIIQRYTSMTVLQVTDGVEVQPNYVYVIPPNHNLALMDGRLVLMQPSVNRGYRFPIDFFFRSLAEVRKNQAIGVVLSGAASDGSLGVKIIKAEGGLTIAQEPDTAEFGDMPRNAIATHDIDYVLPPEKIGEFILKFVRHQVQVDTRSLENPSLSSMGSLQRLYYLLRSKTGHDFSLYKQNTLLRRIDRRLKISLIPSLDAYIKFLQERPEEIDALFHEMLINVTSFFRDPEAFQVLAEKAIRPLIPLKYAAQAPIRVWVPGCSSGEEAYSVAILLQEQLDLLKTDVKVLIYATDLDIDAIIAARRGIYVDGALENVSPERLQRFFNKEDDGYHVKKSIRDMVVFSNQNLIFDPPFSKIDLLCCRNVLIYLEPELQKQLFPLFHYALNPGGTLFLGNSESVGNFNDLFSTLDRKHKIYQRKDVPVQHRISTRIQPGFDQAAPSVAEAAGRRAALGGLREWTERELLKYHSPACVIIDEKNNILYIHGRTGKYLEPSPGESSSNLLRMAREGLKADLATAIHAAVTNDETVIRQGVRVKTNGDYQFINLTVRPVDWEGEDTNLAMVVFEEVQGLAVDAVHRIPDESSRDGRVMDLEKALKEKDEYLTSIINELEDTNQELKSINEELLSSNEEMQSSNEELETSREELQSINEELSTVNAELQNKNVELTQLNNDVYNLLASTEIGTIFLDLDLRLRRFTPAINRVYNFLPGDAGRPLGHFYSNLDYEHLLDDIHQVLTTLTPKAIEAQTKDGVWYLVNIQPYRTLENVIDGIVITFVDITRQKQRDEQRRLDILLRDANDAITVQDFSGNIQSWNQCAVRMYGWSEAEALNMNVLDMVPEHLRPGMLDLYRRLVKGESVRAHETKRLTRDGRVLDIWITMSVLVDYTNQPIGISTIERDITDRKQTDQRLRMENRALRVLNEWHKASRESEAPFARLQEACRLLVTTGGYRLAWVGLLKNETDKGIEPVCSAGIEGEETELPKPVQALARRSQKNIETALQNQRPVAVRGVQSDPAQKAGRAEALKFGYNSFMVLPLIKGKNPLGALAIYADEPEAFVEQEMEYLKNLADEISLMLNHSPGAG